MRDFDILQSSVHDTCKLFEHILATTQAALGALDPAEIARQTCEWLRVPLETELPCDVLASLWVFTETAISPAQARFRSRTAASLRSYDEEFGLLKLIWSRPLEACKYEPVLGIGVDTVFAVGRESRPESARGLYIAGRGLIREAGIHCCEPCDGPRHSELGEQVAGYFVGWNVGVLLAIKEVDTDVIRRLRAHLQRIPTDTGDTPDLEERTRLSAVAVVADWLL